MKLSDLMPETTVIFAVVVCVLIVAWTLFDLLEKDYRGED